MILLQGPNRVPSVPTWSLFTYSLTFRYPFFKKPWQNSGGFGSSFFVSEIVSFSLDLGPKSIFGLLLVSYRINSVHFDLLCDSLSSILTTHHHLKHWVKPQKTAFCVTPCCIEVYMHSFHTGLFWTIASSSPQKKPYFMSYKHRHLITIHHTQNILGYIFEKIKNKNHNFRASRSHTCIIISTIKHK
jgi:hypothetical protein